MADYRSKLNRILIGGFLWEAAVAGAIMGVAVFVIIIFDLSTAAQICITIAVSTTYLGATFAYHVQAINAQIHFSSEFVVRDLPIALEQIVDRFD